MSLRYRVEFCRWNSIQTQSGTSITHHKETAGHETEEQSNEYLEDIDDGTGDFGGIGHVITSRGDHQIYSVSIEMLVNDFRNEVAKGSEIFISYAFCICTHFVSTYGDLLTLNYKG